LRSQSAALRQGLSAQSLKARFVTCKQVTKSGGTLIALVLLPTTIRDLPIMLISAKHPSAVPLQRRTDDKPVKDATALSGEPEAPKMQMQTVKVSERTLAVMAEQHIKNNSGARKIADNVDEAFAKTRVALQTTDPSNVVGSSDSTAVADLKEHMSKSPEQRLRPDILKELGQMEDEQKQMKSGKLNDPVVENFYALT
jgi:hypothetical protein